LTACFVDKALGLAFSSGEVTQSGTAKGVSMIASRRDLFLGAVSVLALAACQGGGVANNMGQDASDMTIGAADAPVQVVEYASLTCPHCKAFHSQVWPQLKANYIDTGKIRFTFREFPTHPQEVAIAGFQVSRCAADGDPQRYFSMIDTFFDQQDAIFAAMEQRKVRESLLTIAQSAGLSEETFEKCVKDPEGPKRIQAVVEKAEKLKVDGTPSFFIDGVKAGPDALTYAGLAKLIDAKLKA
jgi:protein-disulfide isomerase